MSKTRKGFYVKEGFPKRVFVKKVNRGKRIKYECAACKFLLPNKTLLSSLGLCPICINKT